MKKKFGDYQLLVRGNRRTGHLWEGPDHLLYIETSGFLLPFTETYRRIDYKNIQSLSYARTRRGAWITGLILALLGIFAWVIAASARSEPGVATFFGVCAGVLALALIWHLVRGPTCVCTVQTAVQCLILKPVDRMKQARRLAERVGALCLSHQGGGAPAASPADPLPGPAGSGPVAMTEVKPPWPGSRLAPWTMALLVLAGLLLAGEVFVQNQFYFSMDVLINVAAHVLAITTLTRAGRFRVPAGLRGALVAAVVLFVTDVIVGFALFGYANVQVARGIVRGDAAIYSDPGDAAYRFISDAGFEDLGWAAWILVGLGVATALAGLSGLPSAWRRPGAPTAPVPPPRPPGPQPESRP